MTAEERHRLCDALRNTHPSRIMCKEAANEIERLAALAQSNAEPDTERDVFMQVLASLVAAVSLLKAGGKEAVPSDKKFDQMILDYERAIERGGAALAQSDAEPEYYSYPDMDGITTRNVIPAQSDAEPVAWQTRAKGSEDWYIWQGKNEPSCLIDREFYEARPLYTAPPRPDASMGLIEAGLNKLRAEASKKATMTTREIFTLTDSIMDIISRARAANRSGE